jgi:hypothetical protein
MEKIACGDFFKSPGKPTGGKKRGFSRPRYRVATPRLPNRAEISIKPSKNPEERGSFITVYTRKSAGIIPRPSQGTRF